ncbi:MAG: hypothetical protein M3130_08145 [Actinomycetota bacterium]|nr:hypothetical protein [Actinomycetota bacterium]
MSRALRVAAADALESLLSQEGWAHASALPVEAGDTGRFHALFGRDSLVVALQVLNVRPDVAPATLRALAARQGARENPETEEEPGRILHEYRPLPPARLVEQGWPLGDDGGLCYYGSSDATSWFLVVLDATGDARLQAELAHSRQAAGAWLEEALRRGGGLVRCGPRVSPGGLAQQGWRDCLDPAADPFGGGIVAADGSMPASPLADADSQAAAVAALDALTRLDVERQPHWVRLRDRLRERVGRDFAPDVMARDGADRVVPGAGSQLGWLLWSGALSEQAAGAAVERLSRPDVHTKYGVRTLSTDHCSFRADGYHRGAVWPFDCWFAWGGLRASGAHGLADQVRDGVRRALAALGRYPELYSVSRSGELAAIPVANRVQAWTVGAALAFETGWDGRTQAT